MLAIDTNLVVRYIVGDHPRQSEQARSLIDRENVFVSMTVLLETELVLRSVYGFDTIEITAALRAFAGLPYVTTEDPKVIAQALEWAQGGMDFADALHLSKAADCESFISFDQRLARVANRIGTIRVRPP